MQALSRMAYFCSLSFKGFLSFHRKFKPAFVATTYQDMTTTTIQDINHIIVFYFDGRVANIF